VPVSTRPVQHSDALFASPSSIDYRQSGVVTSVKNQGSCGCCWAFSTAGEFESKLSMSTGITYDLSEQYLLQCDTTSYGCNGGYPYSALQLAQSTGIPRETDYPYQPYSRYTGICTNSTGRIKLNSPISNINYYTNLTVEELQQDLVNYGPINVAVCGGNPGFNFAGSSGLISCTPCNIDHAVLLVGYNTTHWIIKNSWGTSWGHNGFGYISKNTSNDCNIRRVVSELQMTSPPPDPTSVTLTITMTDSYGDGWEGYIFAVRQNKKTVGTFGVGFTSGTQSGPTYITVKNNAEVQIVVYQVGNSSH